MNHTAAMALEDLRRLRQAVLDAAARRGATSVRVFGSVARGDSTSGAALSRSDDYRIADILDAAAKLAARIDAVDYQRWADDEDLRLVSEGLVEIIGEAAAVDVPAIAAQLQGRSAIPSD